MVGNFGMRVMVSEHDMWPIVNSLTVFLRLDLEYDKSYDKGTVVVYILRSYN